MSAVQRLSRTLPVKDVLPPRRLSEHRVFSATPAPLARRPCPLYACLSTASAPLEPPPFALVSCNVLFGRPTPVAPVRVCRALDFIDFGAHAVQLHGRA